MHLHLELLPGCVLRVLARLARLCKIVDKWSYVITAHLLVRISIEAILTSLNWQHLTMQVLANPTADIQEGPKVGRADLKTRGVRPYDEKVQSVQLTGLYLPSVTASSTVNTIS